MRNAIVIGLFTASLCTVSCNNSEPAQEAQKPIAEAHEAVPMVTNAHKANEDARKSLTTVYTQYLRVKDALVKTDAAAAQTAATELMGLLSFDTALLSNDEKTAWNEQQQVLHKAAETIAGTADVEQQRTAFNNLSTGMEKAVVSIGLYGQTVYKQYCPMAFDDAGAYWLAGEEEVNNPYFGDKMLHCGVTETAMAY